MIVRYDKKARSEAYFLISVSTNMTAGEAGDLGRYSDQAVGWTGGARCPAERKIILFPETSRPALVPTQPPIH